MRAWNVDAGCQHTAAGSLHVAASDHLASIVLPLTERIEATPELVQRVSALGGISPCTLKSSADSCIVETYAALSGARGECREGINDFDLQAHTCPLRSRSPRQNPSVLL